ncbi:hypothetical protein ACIGXI_39360 [Kitasatospora aureofaciens]|uniref:hypothetical protein n=1 Tax=Kitasatospora aureofaciens TaxID=1894 RepID=UPI0037C7BA05
MPVPLPDRPCARAVTLLPGGGGAARKRLPSVRHRATAPGRGGRPSGSARSARPASPVPRENATVAVDT